MCRKFCSLKGLKIHRTKMGCASQIVTQEKCSVNADETSENQSQEANHSADDTQVVESKDEMQPKLPRIKFPPACDSEAWNMFAIPYTRHYIKKTGEKEV